MLNQGGKGPILANIGRGSRGPGGIHVLGQAALGGGKSGGETPGQHGVPLTEGLRQPAALGRGRRQGSSALLI